MIIVACVAGISANPPSRPVAAHTSTRDNRFEITSDWDIVERVTKVVDISNLLQFDGLDDIPWEEQLDHPVA